MPVHGQGRPVLRMAFPAMSGAVHYNDVIMSTMASQITDFSIVYLTACSCPDQWKYQSSASLAFVRGIRRWPGNFPHKGPVTRKIFPFDDVIMCERDWASLLWTRLVMSECKKNHLYQRFKWIILHTIYFNVSRYEQVCGHVADERFKYICWLENGRCIIQIPLNLIPIDSKAT